MYVQGGTGSVTAGWYQITVRNSATSVTVDRSTGLTAGTGVTLHIGGALQTIATVEAARVASNKIFVKAESTIAPTASIAINGTSGTPSSAVPYTRYIGYTTTRGDGGKVTIQATTNTGITCLAVTTGGISVENFTLDCNSLGTSNGLTSSTGHVRALNCLLKNFTVRGISIIGGTSFLVQGCEFTAGTNAATSAITAAAPGTIRNCNVHDNQCTGIVATTSGVTIERNLVTNNTGASSDGIQTTTAAFVLHNTVYGNGRDGYRGQSSGSGLNTTIKGNIFASNSGWGLQLWTSAGWAADPDYDGNAFYNNTSGTRTNADDITTNKVNSVAAYTNTLDVAVTVGSPFTNAAGSDWTLNNTASQGALLRGTAPQATIPNATGTNYLDFGCFQHQDSGSGGMASPTGIVGLESVRMGA
jgi:parallel beta-helix repeat protein